MKSKATWWGILAAVSTALLWVLSIPPFDFAEAAYIAFVPLLLWLYAKPSGKAFWLLSLATGWAGWLAILIWLRHVTWVGTILLSAVLAGLFLVWVCAARWWIPRLAERGFPSRVIGFAGLAGLWVVLEWVRTWLFWGFPWAPLALSQ
jgi:apolipoprotein N-acyltransferase